MVEAALPRRSQVAAMIARPVVWGKGFKVCDGLGRSCSHASCAAGGFRLMASGVFIRGCSTMSMVTQMLSLARIRLP